MCGFLPDWEIEIEDDEEEDEEETVEETEEAATKDAPIDVTEEIKRMKTPAKIEADVPA